MLYRFALALGLLFLGIHVGREIARTKPARTRLKQARAFRPERLLTIPTGKMSVH